MNLLKTILPNQLVQNGNFESASGWYSYQGSYTVSDNVATFTINHIYSNYRCALQNNSTPLYVGHKHFVSFFIKLDNASTFYPRFFMGGNFIVPYSTTLPLDTNWHYYSGIFTANDTNFQIGAQDFSQYQGTTFKVKKVMAVDLTLLYGAGNEPTTVADFTKNYPLPYYPYSLTNTTGLLTCANGAVTADLSSMLPSGIGCVDIGTMSLLHSPPYFYGRIADDFAIGTQDAICAKYRGYSSPPSNTGFYINTAGNINFVDSNYTDVASFKNANAGVLLFYKKA